MHYVYILQSQNDGTYYIGSTGDVEGRLARHNAGRSQYTRSRRPRKLMRVKTFSDRGAAMKREREIKRMKSRKGIEDLVGTSRV